MAVAVQPSTETKGASASAPLWLASLIGALFLLGSLAVVFYAVPKAWDAGVSGWMQPAVGVFANAALRFLAQIAAAVVLGFVGSRLFGRNPPRGIRGGVFLTVVSIFLIFFAAEAVGRLAFRSTQVGTQGALTVFGVAAAVFAFLGLRFLRGDRFRAWAVGMDEAGWFRAHSYKRSQGQRVRRLTVLGILLLVGSGVYTLIHNNHLPVGESWDVSAPFLPRITLLPDVGLTVPLIFGLLGLWLAYRVVNYPPFADFLIATEAEMNKVSWTPRKRLLQDTAVVLVTLIVLTLFLLVVDVFWGWLLSRELIGVLPPTRYQYDVVIQRVDPAKKDAVVTALQEFKEGDFRITPEAARALVERSPAGDENRAAQPQPVLSADRDKGTWSQEAADHLARRLREAGADVAVERARGKRTVKLNW